VTAPGPDGDETRGRILFRRIFLTLVVLAALGGLVLAAQHTRRGDEPAITVSGTKTAVVELVAPQPDSSVLSQAQIEIDLTTDYDAHLIVNGTRIPDDQLLKRPELAQVFFSPGPGKAIEKLKGGQNCVEAIIFRRDGTDQQVDPANWCFNVT
jgi:hypothetical protein